MAENTNIKTPKKRSNLSRFFRVFFSRGFTTKICFAILVILVLCAVFAPLICKIIGFDAYQQDLFNMLKPPSKTHLLGTDNIGRDTLARLVYGARVSLLTGILSSIWAAFSHRAAWLPLSGFSSTMIGALPAYRSRSCRKVGMVSSVPHR